MRSCPSDPEEEEEEEGGGGREGPRLPLTQPVREDGVGSEVRGQRSARYEDVLPVVCANCRGRRCRIH